MDTVIESRKFATSFRKSFKRYAHEWPNVDTAFGPLDSHGRVSTSERPGKIQDQVWQLASKFLTIEQLVDTTLLNLKNKVHIIYLTQSCTMPKNFPNHCKLYRNIRPYALNE